MRFSRQFHFLWTKIDFQKTKFFSPVSLIRADLRCFIWIAMLCACFHRLVHRREHSLQQRRTSDRRFSRLEISLTSLFRFALRNLQRICDFVEESLGFGVVNTLKPSASHAASFLDPPTSRSLSVSHVLLVFSVFRASFEGLRSVRPRLSLRCWRLPGVPAARLPAVGSDTPPRPVGTAFSAAAHVVSCLFSAFPSTRRSCFDVPGLPGGHDVRRAGHAPPAQLQQGRRRLLLLVRAQNAGQSGAQEDVSRVFGRFSDVRVVILADLLDFRVLDLSFGLIVNVFSENLADRPVHVAQDSLFSSSSGWTNYRGFFNLAVLLLVSTFVSNFTS